MINDKENPDFIIVAYHGGYECNLETGLSEAKNSDENLGCKIFTQINDIDLLLTGHEHRLITHRDGNRVIHQVGYAGSHVSHTIVTFSKDEKWEVTSEEASLVSMETYKDDQDILNHLSNFLKFADVQLNEIIGYATPDFLINDAFDARLHKHKVIQYINEVQMKTTQAMISCCGLGNDVTGFHETITLRDVLNTYVFPNTLFLCEITGKTLIEALNHNARFFVLNEFGDFDINPSYLYPKKEFYNYDIFDGIDYEIIVKKDGANEVKNVMYQGKRIIDHKIYTLVLNSYRMSGGGNITWNKSLKVIKAYPLDITEILIQDIKEKKKIDINYQKNITINKS